MKIRPALFAPYTLVAGLIIASGSSALAAIPAIPELPEPTPAAAAQAFKNQLRIWVDGDYRYVESNGIPDHKMGDFPNANNPNSVAAQTYLFRVPVNPKEGQAAQYSGGQLFGVALNGVPFDPGTAELWSPGGRRGPGGGPGGPGGPGASRGGPGGPGGLGPRGQGGPEGLRGPGGLRGPEGGPGLGGPGGPGDPALGGRRGPGGLRGAQPGGGAAPGGRGRGGRGRRGGAGGPGGGPGAEGEWRYEAIGSSLNLGLDTNNAHVQPNGAYHYHGLPAGLIRELQGGLDDAQVTLLGYAADGFPIYNQNCTTTATLGARKIEVVRPSWRLKKGERPGGALGPGGAYSGEFTQDWEYVAKSGDLDECNGHIGPTPENPQGIYHYHITDKFPYVSREFRGAPDMSFIKTDGPGARGGRGARAGARTGRSGTGRGGTGTGRGGTGRGRRGRRIPEENQLTGMEITGTISAA